VEEVYISIVEGMGCRWGIFANDRAVTRIYPLNTDILSCDNLISRLAADQISEYMINIRKELDFPLELHGTLFQRQVWHTLRAIPYGMTASYSAIAAMIGRPKAVRAVGQAIGRNPCLIVVPCHRVLSKNGSLTGFSAGMELKKKLLHHEGMSDFL